MLEEKAVFALNDEEGEVGGESLILKRDFIIDIDEMEIEFVGQTPRLVARIEITLEAPV